VWHHKKELILYYLECTRDSGHWTMDWTLDSIDFQFLSMVRGQTSHAKF